MSIFGRSRANLNFDEFKAAFRFKPFPDKGTPEAEALLKRLRKEVFMKRGRRIELSADDTKVMRAEMIRQNAKREWDVDMNMMPLRADDPPFPYPEDCTEIKIRGVPCFLDRTETKVVVWDDREQWLVLSATCFTPEPKE